MFSISATTGQLQGIFICLSSSLTQKAVVFHHLARHQRRWRLCKQVMFQVVSPSPQKLRCFVQIQTISIIFLRKLRERFLIQVHAVTKCLSEIRIHLPQKCQTPQLHHIEFHKRYKKNCTKVCFGFIYCIILIVRIHINKL